MRAEIWGSTKREDGIWFIPDDDTQALYQPWVIFIATKGIGIVIRGPLPNGEYL